MIAERIVVQELLDHLPPEDPRALASRRDIGRINSLIRQPAIMAGLLAEHKPHRILDIGAGDGSFMLKVASRMNVDTRVDLTLLDQHALLTPDRRRGFENVGWECEIRAADVFRFLDEVEDDEFDVIVANLFLHHFRDAKLRDLLALVAAKTRVFVACEPLRSQFALTGTRMLWAFGCNDVTRFDARVSVLAGFRGRELSALWTDHDKWSIDEYSIAPFTQVFKAFRKA